MITVENQSLCFVGLGGSQELAISNAGQWHFEVVTYVAGGTNAQTDCSGLRDGAWVVVDLAGRVKTYDGPDLGYYAGTGFGLAISALGVLMAIRWVWRRFFSAAGINPAVVDT